jgi:SAM-dependent methyltransferase
VGPTGHVTGIDVAERQLEIARRKALARGLRNIAFRLGDMRQLDYPNAAFDAVVCVFAIFFAADMVAQVKALWRLVRPGGRLAMTTWGPRVLEPAASGWRSAVRALRPYLGRRSIPGTGSPSRRHAAACCAKRACRGRKSSQRADCSRFAWRRIGGVWCLDQAIAGPSNRWDPRPPKARRMNLDWIRAHRIEAVETNVLLAIAENGYPFH